MTVKPIQTIRTFTVDRRWTMSQDDVKNLICKYLGIPYTPEVDIELAEYGDIEIRQVSVTQQTE